MSNRIKKFEENIAILMFVLYSRMNSLIESYKEQDIRFLFFPRDGIVLKKHLNQLRESKNLKQFSDDNLFWINRNSASSTIIDNKRYFEFLTKQLGKSHKKKYEALARNFNVSLKNVDFNNVTSKHIEFLVRHTEKQREENFKTYGAYLKSFNTKNFVIIDSGWNGTTESILKDIFPEYNFSRINIGVLSRSSQVSAFGIIFDNYDPNSDFWFFRFCRHLFEVILEPKMSSQIGLELISNKFHPKFDNPSEVISDKIAGDFGVKIEKKLFQLFDKHKNSKKSIYEIFDLEKLKIELENDILFPDAELSLRFEEETISHDLGVSGRISIIGLPSNNIEDLWPQANFAAYYNEDLALGYQNKLSKMWKEKQPQIKNFVDVITRTMDRPFFLERALHSVHSQAYKYINHIIVIDGSASEPIFKKIKDTIDDISNIKVVHLKKNSGMEAASNIAISQGVGDYIHIHDDDDSIDQKFYLTTLRFLLKNKIYNGVVTASKHVSELVSRRGLIIKNVKDYNPHISQIFFHDILEENTFAPISFVFERNAYDQIGPFDEKLEVLGDWDFNIRFLEKFDIGFINERLANYHHRDVEADIAFGNSVTAGLDKHVKFQPIVRNNLFRRNPAFAITSNQKFIKNFNRHLVQSSISNLKNMTRWETDNDFENIYQIKLIYIEKILEYNLELSLINEIIFCSKNELKKKIPKLLTRMPRLEESEFFDRERYLKKFPAVENLVKEGAFYSELVHFMRWGIERVK